MPIKIITAAEIPKPARRPNLSTQMTEWGGIRDRILDHRLPADRAWEVALGPDSLALLKSKNITEICERFRMHFVRAYPPAEYRYSMTTREGKIYVENNPVRNGDGNGKKGVV